MDLIYIALAGLVSLLAARAPLAAGIGQYWRCWSFAARPLSTVLAMLEFMFWAFLAGALAGAAAIEGVQLAGLDAKFALTVISLGLGAGAALLTRPSYKKLTQDDGTSDFLAALAGRAVRALDSYAIEGINTKSDRLGNSGLGGLARKIAARVLAAKENYEEPQREAIAVVLKAGSDELSREPVPGGARERLIDACTPLIIELRLGYTWLEWRRLRKLG